MTKLEKPAGIVVLTHPVHWPLAPQDVVDALTPDLLVLPRESLAIDGVPASAGVMIVAVIGGGW